MPHDGDRSSRQRAASPKHSSSRPRSATPKPTSSSSSRPRSATTKPSSSSSSRPRSATPKPSSSPSKRTASARNNNSNGREPLRQSATSVTAVTRPNSAREKHVGRATQQKYYNSPNSFGHLVTRLQACATGYTSSDKERQRARFEESGKAHDRRGPSQDRDRGAGKPTVLQEPAHGRVHRFQDPLYVPVDPHASTSLHGGDMPQLLPKKSQSQPDFRKERVRQPPLWDGHEGLDLRGSVRCVTQVSKNSPDFMQRVAEPISPPLVYQRGDEVPAAGTSALLCDWNTGKQIVQPRVQSFSPRSAARSCSPRSKSSTAHPDRAAAGKLTAQDCEMLLEVKPVKPLFLCPATGRVKSTMLTSAAEVLPEFMHSPRQSSLNRARYEDLLENARSPSYSPRLCQAGKGQDAEYAGVVKKPVKGIRVGVRQETGRVCESWKISVDAPKFMHSSQDNNKDHIVAGLEKRDAVDQLTPRARANREKEIARANGDVGAKRSNFHCPVTKKPLAGAHVRISPDAPDFWKNPGDLPLVVDHGFLGQRGLRAPQGHSREGWVEAHHEDKRNRDRVVEQACVRPVL